MGPCVLGQEAHSRRHEGTVPLLDRPDHVRVEPGPGERTYILTVYALSAPPQLNVPPEQVTRDVLLAAIQDRTLASAQLSVRYTRPAEALAREAGSNAPQAQSGPGQGQPRGRDRAKLKNSAAAAKP